MPNFVKISQSVAKILRFLDFSRWRWPPSWIVEFTKFHWLTVAGCQNWSFHCRDVAIFRFFKMTTAAILNFLESPNFISYTGGEGWDTSGSQILSKSVNRSQRYYDFFRFFNRGAATILDCRIHKILLAVGVWRAHMHDCTKFRQNRSFRCRDIAIFRIFQLATTAILDFLNHEILLAIVIERV